MPVLKGHPVETKTSHIPKRWVTGRTRVAGFIDGPDEAMWHAHVEAGKPADITTFRDGWVAGLREGGRKSPLVEELAAELQKAHRIIYFQRMQMSTPQRATYARVAHAAGVIADDETRETERAALLARAGVTS
jgi:hypothetical protein